MDVETVIIGAGVIGLACAQRLTASGRSVLVIERHGSFGQETSSRSSEVVHAGIYYPTGSRKARLCVEGARLLYAWCEQRGVAHARVGKYIVATSAAEEPMLDAILRQAHANGATQLCAVDRNLLRREEPNVRATAGLWSPATGIVDSHGFMRSLAKAASDRDCTFAWSHRLVGVEPARDGFHLRIEDPSGEQLQVHARTVINAAGLDADRVASLAGIDVAAAGYEQTFVKGHYFRVRRRGLVRSLVYPVPPIGLAGLGVHVTVDLAGEARLGPDVEVLRDRVQRYDVPEALASRFFEAASRYLVGLELEDLQPDQAGIRPKLGLPGGPVRDFVIDEESARGLPGWINLIGMESPGLTASLAIAEEVVALLRWIELGNFS